MRVIEEIAQSALANRTGGSFTAVALSIVIFLVFRVEVSNGRADRLSKSAHPQLRMEEEIAGIRPLNHGHHRTAKQPRRELPSTVESAPSQKNRNSSFGKSQCPGQHFNFETYRKIRRFQQALYEICYRS
jgi:hypothetical protein